MTGRDSSKAVGAAASFVGMVEECQQQEQAMAVVVWRRMGRWACTAATEGRRIECFRYQKDWGSSLRLVAPACTPASCCRLVRLSGRRWSSYRRRRICPASCHRLCCQVLGTDEVVVKEEATTWREGGGR